MNAHNPRAFAATRQANLFGAPDPLPKGFRYQPDLLTADEEAGLARELSGLPFDPFDFHGYLANRRVVGFGRRHDYANRILRPAAP